MKEELEPDSPFGDINPPPRPDPVQAYQENLCQQRQFRVQLFKFYGVAVIIVLISSVAGIICATKSTATTPTVLAYGVVGELIGMILGWAFGVWALGRAAVQADTYFRTTSMPTYVARGAANARLWGVASFAALIGIGCGATVGALLGLRQHEPLDAPHLSFWLWGGSCLGMVVAAIVGFCWLRPNATKNSP